MDLVSVVITCYNKDKFIEETIRSVLKQTYNNLEVIVINDGSTDQSLKIINQIIDTRLKVFDFKNAGQNASRNKGLIRCTGKYIAFLDGDDLWHPMKIEKQVDFLHTHNGDMCFCNYDTIDIMGNINKSFKKIDLKKFSHEALRHKILHGNYILGSASSVIVKKNIVDKIGLFDEKLKWGEDWEYWTRIVFETSNILFLNRCLTYLRFGIEQVQSSLALEKRYEDSVRILKKAITNYQLSHKQKSIVYSSLLRAHYTYGSSYFALVRAYLSAIRYNIFVIFDIKLFFLLLKFPLKSTLKK